MVLFIEIHLLSCRLTNYCFSSSSDVVTMSLQMSPVNAHSENQPPFYYQPAGLLPEAAAGTSSHKVEPFLCQHLECSSTEQVPLPTKSKSCSTRLPLSIFLRGERSQHGHGSY